MSYDNPNRQVYMLPSLDWGANVSENFGIVGPKGKSGTLIDYGIMGCTETFSSDSMTMAIGTAADPDAFGEEFILNGCADASGKTVRSTYDPIANKAAFDALMVAPHIPANTIVQVTMVGASAAGIGSPYVVIDWAN